MTNTLDARSFILDFLRRELVGPSPGHPAVQIDGEEILRPQDPRDSAMAQAFYSLSGPRCSATTKPQRMRTAQGRRNHRRWTRSSRVAEALIPSP